MNSFNQTAVANFLSDNGSEELVNASNSQEKITRESVDSIVKINMDAVIAEFKARLAYEKKCFQSMSKREQREVRSERKVFNQHVEQVIVDWRASKAEETACETPEWWNFGIDRWDMRNPPSNIFQIEHALELPDSQKKWLFTHVGNNVSAL